MQGEQLVAFSEILACLFFNSLRHSNATQKGYREWRAGPLWVGGEEARAAPRLGEQPAWRWGVGQGGEGRRQAQFSNEEVT